MSKYRNSPTEPESLKQMLAMLTKPGPPIEDPATVAIRLTFAIYLEFKSKVLLGDKTPETIERALRDARERTVLEVPHVIIRANAAARYDAMLERLTTGGEIEI